jgi:hypothetical protein
MDYSLLLLLARLGCHVRGVAQLSALRSFAAMRHDRKRPARRVFSRSPWSLVRYGLAGPPSGGPAAALSALPNAQGVRLFDGQFGPASFLNVPLLENRPPVPIDGPPKNQEKNASS